MLSFEDIIILLEQATDLDALPDEVSATLTDLPPWEATIDAIVASLPTPDFDELLADINSHLPDLDAVLSTLPDYADVLAALPTEPS